MRRLTSLIEAHNSSVTMLVGATDTERTDAFVEPLVTSTPLLVEADQAACVPMCVLAGLNIVRVDIGTSRSKRPVAACEQLSTRQ